jgi:hypothetical protein
MTFHAAILDSTNLAGRMAQGGLAPSDLVSLFVKHIPSSSGHIALAIYTDDGRQCHVPPTNVARRLSRNIPAFPPSNDRTLA